MQRKAIYMSNNVVTRRVSFQKGKNSTLNTLKNSAIQILRNFKFSIKRT